MFVVMEERLVGRVGLAEAAEECILLSSVADAEPTSSVLIGGRLIDTLGSEHGHKHNGLVPVAVLLSS